MKYQDYLQSDEWKIKRQLALQQAGGRCRICNSDESLHVHHRSYERRGTPEEVLDLVVLCAECHDLFHQKDEAEKIRVSNGEWALILGCIVNTIRENVATVDDKVFHEIMIEVIKQIVNRNDLGSYWNAAESIPDVVSWLNNGLKVRRENKKAIGNG